jgi:DNA-binding beta-propeller fold protein YncE
LATQIGVLAAMAGSAHAQKVYWTDIVYEGSPPVARHVIRRANTDGSNIEIVVDTGQSAYSIAVDPPRGQIYWTVVGGAIYRANVPNGSAELVLTTEAPLGIAMDIAGARLYWGFGKDFDAGIRRTTVDGGAVETIYDGGNVGPESLAVDGVGQKLYWTQPAAGWIARANLDGNDAHPLVEYEYPLTPLSIAVDPIGEKMYWTLRDSKGESPGKLQRANFDGTGIEDLAILPPAPAWPEVAVDPYGAKVYWSDPTAIRRANFDGSGAEVIIPAGAGPIVLVGELFDLGDYAVFQNCTGSTAVPPSCERFDLQPDEIVDLRDLPLLLLTFHGPE